MKVIDDIMLLFKGARETLFRMGRSFFIIITKFIKKY